MREARETLQRTEGELRIVTEGPLQGGATRWRESEEKAENPAALTRSEDGKNQRASASVGFIPQMSLGSA